jgi:hypothetical protein
VLSSSINEISTMPSNSTYNLSLPPNINGINYTIRLKDNSIKIEYGDKLVSCEFGKLTLSLNPNFMN